jgi:GAF domain-containing protein
LQERADELDRRARQFEAIVRVSHDTTALFEQEEMLQRTTRSIKEQFGFDTVAVYLTDKPGGEISLRAVAGATPEAGARPVQLETVIQTIRSGASRIIQTSAEETQPGPGGLVLPLQVRDQVIGALEVQSGERAAFSDEDIAILQTMADQIAIAIENARLFGEAQASLQELNALYRQYAAEAWRGYVQAKPEAIRYSHGTVTCPAQVWQTAREQARTSGEAVVFVGDDDGEGAIQSLAVPVSLRGLPIGVLGFHRPAGAGAWQPEEIAMVRMVADRLALAVENIRLLEDAQQRAHEEHLLGEITASIRASMDVDTILQTAVRGLGQAIGVDRVSVYLAPEEEAA